MRKTLIKVLTMLFVGFAVTAGISDVTYAKDSKFCIKSGCYNEKKNGNYCKRHSAVSSTSKSSTSSSKSNNSSSKSSTSSSKSSNSSSKSSSSTGKSTTTSNNTNKRSAIMSENKNSSNRSVFMSDNKGTNKNSTTSSNNTASNKNTTTKKSSTTTKTQSTKKTYKMPDCDDYESFEEFMDDWDGCMPDGSDAEEYWYNW